MAFVSKSFMLSHDIKIEMDLNHHVFYYHKINLLIQVSI